MGRSIAAFYTPDDGLEHAIQIVEPAPGQNSGFPIMDVTFSPETQGHIAPAAAFTPLNTQRTIGATYSPIDGYRYIFFATTDNKVFWSRYTGNYKNPPNDPILRGQYPLVNELLGYPPSSIVDLAAYFSGGQLEVLVLMKNGDLWRMGGEPWSNQLSWSLIPFFARFIGGRRLAVFEGAGWGHVIIATIHDIVEVYYTWNRWGQVKIWTFDKQIIDVGTFYTPEDGVAHIIVATTALNQRTDVHEITFVPAQMPPTLRQLGTVNFIIHSLGAYVKPDLGRHVIMLEAPVAGPPVDLYLSWYYPGWVGFQYSSWPPLQAW
ncbi:hypothetical protein [Azotobacter chroococcum]|uniref:Fucose-specific lectin n=1 Tax=Azotobacter chroococcum TaxID=353 RepID=A0AAP9YF72_9GAMM|nr:hypothetical protein [Azotobacter chroococcum]QQE89508.1 hypothetical protein GKQ51_03905 [Azotobacter chroococcum]